MESEKKKANRDAYVAWANGLGDPGTGAVAGGPVRGAMHAEGTEVLSDLDRAAFEVLAAARTQYAAYLSLQDTLATVLAAEPEMPEPTGIDHPLGLVVCD